MQKLTLFFLTGLFISFLSGCGEQKEVSEATGYENVTKPCSSDEYETTEKYFRANFSGESQNEATSKKIAIQNAKSELASQIKEKVSEVTEQYTDQKDVGKKQEYMRNFQETTRTAVDQSLSNVSVICEQLQKKKGEEAYKTYVAVEMPVESLKNTLNDQISKDDRVRMEYNKQQFEEIFDEEMKKLEEDRP